MAQGLCHRWATTCGRGTHRHQRSRPLRRCGRSEEHTSELQSQSNLVCRLLLEKKNVPLTTKNKNTKKKPAPHLTASPRAVLPGSETAPFVPSAAIQTAGETAAPSATLITVSVV